MTGAAQTNARGDTRSARILALLVALEALSAATPPAQASAPLKAAA